MLETPKAPAPDIGKAPVDAAPAKMDNQQATTLAYLAGIFDGEGCISLSRQTKRNGRCNLHRIVQVTNTDRRLVADIVGFCDAHDIRHHVAWYKLRHKKHKPYATILIRQMDGIKKFLLLLRPYLRVKAQRADLMLRFIERRGDIYRTKQRNTSEWAYAEEDFAIADAMRGLNAKGNRCLNDYTSDAGAPAKI